MQCADESKPISFINRRWWKQVDKSLFCLRIRKAKLSKHHKNRTNGIKKE